jgi:hypothetical protein
MLVLQIFTGQGLKKERFGSASKSLIKWKSARTFCDILSRKFVGISTLHTSKSAANSRYAIKDWSLLLFP